MLHFQDLRGAAEGQHGLQLELLQARGAGLGGGIPALCPLAGHNKRREQLLWGSVDLFHWQKPNTQEAPAVLQLFLSNDQSIAGMHYRTPYDCDLECLYWH